MTDLTQSPPPLQILTTLWSKHRVWLVAFGILAVLSIVNPPQARDSAIFAGTALWGTAPYLLASILIAAWAGATGADNLIARAFTGSPVLMIGLAALAGGLSPFCSCGVIPLIAALLAMGVPLSAVMAFWLASPLMDPSMFALTSGVLGWDFAIAKTLVAVGLGVMGGAVVHALTGTAFLTDVLRDGIGNGGCGGSKLRAPKPVHWRFWNEPDRRVKFRTETVRTTLFLGKWLFLAFILESLMLAYIPAETIAAYLGGSGLQPIALSTVIGVPAYFNGYAALPLVAGLMEQGMTPGAGMAFLIAGGVTSIPAAVAVWALVKPRVFGLYIGLSLGGAFLAGMLFQLWSAVG